MQGPGSQAATEPEAKSSEGGDTTTMAGLQLLPLEAWQQLLATSTVTGTTVSSQLQAALNAALAIEHSAQQPGQGQGQQQGQGQAGGSDVIQQQQQLVNVNNRLVSEDTVLRDGDLVILARERIKI